MRETHVTGAGPGHESPSRGLDDGSRGARVDLLKLDVALSRLATLDLQQVKVVELRHFTGLGIEEVAQVLGISPAMVRREWAMARAWPRRELARA